MTVEKFSDTYKRLNAAQKKAVDTIDGPVMVIAGPGTGKTQLLSVRVGKILQETDTSPESILCVTFTEAAAQELRERLHSLLGPSGSKVSVYTFHGFGSEIINRYPEYFDVRRRGLSQLDDIAMYALYEELLTPLPYRHPFAAQDENGQFTSLRAVQSGIKAIKQAALSSEDLQKILAANTLAIDACEPAIREVFDVPRLNIKLLDGIEQVAEKLHSSAGESSIAGYQAFEQSLGQSLLDAIAKCREENKTGAVGKWREKFLRRRNGKYVLYARTKIQEFEYLIELYAAYQKLLSDRGLYDYEDMILWALEACKNNEDLRLSLAEQYLYIMVDEYQDTNGAQNQLLHEISGIQHDIEQPNVLVVGDDDQAIMRFQGAEVSNLLDFVDLYNPRLITLSDNYRSHSNILTASHQVITQTNERLESSVKDISKQLTAKATHKNFELGRYQFESPSQEFAWVAKQIEQAIKDGTPRSQIGIIAPKHAILTSFVPFLQALNISVSYERRENILEQPLVIQLLIMCQLIAALAENHIAIASSLLPKVLSYPFWDLTPIERAQLALKAENDRTSWLETMLVEESKLRDIAELLLAIKDQSLTFPLELVLDMLIGTREVPGTTLKFSPLKKYYFSAEAETENPALYMQLLSNLTALRDTARNHFAGERYSLIQFLEVMQLYQRSGIKLLDTNPLMSNPDAVQVMTAHGAKGREFERVYLLQCIEDTWGPSARGHINQAYVPENLPIYPPGNSAADKIRLLYVAMTRAKYSLVITSHSCSELGRPTKPLSLLDFDGDGWWTLKSMPAAEKADQLSIVLTQWQQAYELPASTLQELLADKLRTYRLSFTHLKNFLDLRYGGPEHFKVVNLFRFPEAKNLSSSFGSAIHSALERAQLVYKETGKVPSASKVVEYFYEALDREQLSPIDDKKARVHGEKILPLFYANEKLTMQPGDSIERSFRAQLGEVRLSGKLDKISTDAKQNCDVIDYKTGKAPQPDWETRGLTDAKKTALHFNRLQLLFYKLLVEQGSTSKVNKAELRYVEPHTDTGEFVTLRIDTFDASELADLQKLIEAVWKHIINLDFPDTSSFKPTLQGIIDFQQALIDGRI